MRTVVLKQSIAEDRNRVDEIEERRIHEVVQEHEEETQEFALGDYHLRKQLAEVACDGGAARLALEFVQLRSGLQSLLALLCFTELLSRSGS